jgi:hypothetical protein
MRKSDRAGVGEAVWRRAENQFDFPSYFEHLLDLYLPVQSCFAVNVPAPF